jgi:crotonobetainyl-CoA:carnitine CoA-transferase CaiB-like acyl-CoA transferase
MDPVLQAYTGLMNENRGEDGIPHRVPVIVVDMSTALYAFPGACRPRSMPAATRRAAATSTSA